MHGYVIGLKIETTSDERRDEAIRALVAALDLLMRPGDSAAFTLKKEIPFSRGSEKRERTVKWEMGEPAPTLLDFGITATQLGLFSEQLRDLMLDGIHRALDRTTGELGEVAVADDEQSDEPEQTQLDELLLDDEGQKRADIAEQLLDGLRSDQHPLDEQSIDRMIDDAINPKKPSDEQPDDEQHDTA